MQQDHRVFDPWIPVAAAVLGGLGLLNIASLEMGSLAVRHAVFLLVGFGLMVLFSRIRLRALPAVAWTVYALALVMLLAVPMVGMTVNGAQRWLDLGFFTAQPAELAKVAIVLVLAALLGRGYQHGRFLLALVVAAVPVVLVAVQPNLSSAIVVATAAGLMLILARVPLLPLLPLFGLAVAALPLAVIILRPYQLGRVHAFLTGARGSDGPGWAALQAEIAVGDGGLLGRAREPLYGLTSSYLPEREHDLAFASLIHGWGLVAGVLAVAAVLVLVWRCAVAARLARSRDAALVSAGVAVLFGLHAVVSIAVNLSLVPHTGLPIPLLSYGGTTAVVHLAALGFVLGARADGVQRPLWAPAPKRKLQPRWARAGAAVLTANLVGMSLVAWNVQLERGAELAMMAHGQMTRCIRLPAERGIITDRTGKALVANTRDYRVHIVPGLFPADDPREVGRLARLLRMTPPELTKLLTDRSGELWASTGRVSRSVARKVAGAAQPGVLVAPSNHREYPQGRMLAPLLGYVGVASPDDMARWPSLALGAVAGKAGLEYQYDALLRGIDGRQCVYVDPLGRPVAAAERVDPVAGHDLRLHLDLEMQKVASKALADAVESSPGDLGGAVVMDARTGGVLAMASAPAYDNNIYGPPADLDALQQEAAADGLPFYNHVTQVAAPPGSTFKIVVAAANARYRVLPPEQVIATGGAFTFGGHTFHNWKPLGPNNMIQAIQWSDNVYFYKLALMLGPEKIAKTASALGVGELTGIDLPGEAAGYLGTPKAVTESGGQWYPGTTVIMGIGQGAVTATPLQLARWTVGIGAGRLLTPQLAKSYGVTGKHPLRNAEPEKVPFANKLGPVRAGMRASFQAGTGASLATLPITGMTKTGTAQDPNGGTNAWFSALVPAEKPQLVVTSFVRGGGYGSAVSGPVVKAILEHWLDHR